MTTKTPAGVPTPSWPDGGLESVNSCPVCGAQARVLLHGGLTDRVFFTAPSEWNMWRCGRCESAYLDPRPDEATIGLAYGTYYTHEHGPMDDQPDAHGGKTRLQRLRHALGNGYRNRRYGLRLEPALSLGWLVAAGLPPLRWPIDIGYRYLPRRRRERTCRLLDIGCGNGEWLSTASTDGWVLAGVEPDPLAREAAAGNGVEVRATVGDWIDHRGAFDFITLNHVIEHVHDPIKLLRECAMLLRPGGGLFIETPNIDARSHERFGADWRGLEPPRHLVMFNRESLATALEDAGFINVRYRGRPSPLEFLDEQSRRIAAGVDPYGKGPPIRARSPSRIAILRSHLDRTRAEFLTLTASLPS